MTQAARKIRELPLPQSSDYLGPGHVIVAKPHELEVEIRGEERVTATMALAFPYAPVEGDVLLVIGKDREYYVIGVIHGRGRAGLSFQGSVDIRAEGGTLTLESDQGVAIRGPDLSIEAGKMQVFAGTVVEKLGSLYQRVRGALNVRAKETHTIVDERSLLTAKNASVVTEETMSINGREIHIG